MATRRLSFALPYEPETRIGAAIGQVSNALFGGPTAYEIEAQQAARDAARAKAALDQGELAGRGKLGSLFGEYQNAIAGDPAARATLARDFGARLAQVVAEAGGDPAKAGLMWRMAASSPVVGDRERADVQFGVGGPMKPYDAVSATGEFGLLKQQARKTADATSTAVAGAAAANPDKYYKVGLQKDIVGADRTGIDARRIAGVESAPTADTQNRRELARVTGVDETSLAQFDMAQKVIQRYALPFGGYNMPMFEKDNPELARVYKNVGAMVTRAQNSPRVNGQRPSPDGQGWTIPSPINGAHVPARREADGKWYFRDVDGQVKRIDRPDY